MTEGSSKVVASVSLASADYNGVATCAKSTKNAKSTIPFTIYSMTFSPWQFWHWPLLLLVLDLIM